MWDISVLHKPTDGIYQSFLIILITAVMWKRIFKTHELSEESRKRRKNSSVSLAFQWYRKGRNDRILEE